MSTGMNTLDSIKKSVLIIRKYKIPFALLHCVNLYPTPSELTKIECLFEIKKAYPDAVIGLSDHTTNIYSCLGSVALGSRVIEKHFVDNKVNRRGPDISSSMDSSELKLYFYAGLEMVILMSTHSKLCMEKELHETLKIIVKLDF